MKPNIPEIQARHKDSLKQLPWNPDSGVAKAFTDRGDLLAYVSNLNTEVQLLRNLIVAYEIEIRVKQTGRVTESTYAAIDNRKNYESALAEFAAAKTKTV